jgi:DNA replication protein DnaC
MTQTIDGLTLPDEMVNACRASKRNGQQFVVRVTSGGPCANCGGAGYLYVLMLMASSLYPPGLGKPATFEAGKWWHYNRIAYACPVCNAHDHAARIEMLLEASGLLENEGGWHLDFIAGKEGKADALSAARIMQAGAPQPSGWLLLYGTYGMGKSGILKSLTAALCRTGTPARYVNAMDIVLEIQDGFHSNDREATALAIINRYSRYKFLAVDEIDRVNTTQWTLSILFKLFDDRYNRRDVVATALATNRTPQSMRDDTWGYFESRTRDGARVLVSGEGLRG